MDLIQGRRRYSLTLLKNPDRYRLVGALGLIAEAGPIQAICLSRPKADVGECLQTNHGCGHNISKEVNPHNGTGDFIAEVIGWGKFIEGERGWRTEYMEIVGIICPKGTPTDIQSALKDCYNCEVRESD